MTQPDDGEIDAALSEALERDVPISSLAELILSASDQSGPPVDLSRVVELWPRLRVSLDDLDGEGYLVDLGGRSGEILVKRRTARARRRFTLAHELGHWVLALSRTKTARWSRARVEQWCDEFARELLIPRAWLLASLRLSHQSLAGVVSDLPTLYHVSRQPMWIQCSHHDLLSLVVAGQRVEEYPATVARPAERAALVRATLEHRDQHNAMPFEFVIGSSPGVVFHASRVITMGLLSHMPISGE